MQRRDVLKSASVLATATTVGLAGCSGDSSNGGTQGTTTDDDGEPAEQNTPESGCQLPGDDLSTAFPDSSEYEQQQSQIVGEGETESDVIRGGVAMYTGPDGTEYVAQVIEYVDVAAAETRAQNNSENIDPGDGAVGFIRVENVIYVGSGPDEASVVAFMQTSSLLAGCVEANISFV
jgi:hypothetical protein